MQIRLKGGRAVNIDVQKKHIKNLTLRVYPDGSVKISAPVGMSDSRIRQFVEEKKAWLEKHVLEKGEGRREPPDLTIRLLGRSLPYTIIKADRNSVEVEDDRVFVYCKDTAGCTCVLDNWWKKTALEYYNLYVDKWMGIFEEQGITRPRISVRKMKSMWGSCTHAKETIRYNYYLLMTPPQCVEYVVLHELAHLIYPNHGERFKAFLTKYMPDWKLRQKRMKQETAFIGMF